MQLWIPGRVFDPSDEEIVSYYLPNLIAADGKMGLLGDLSHFFNACDVYSRKPLLLFENNNDQPLPYMKANQRFFFSPRQKIAQKNSNGKRPRRTLEGEPGGQGQGQGGYWKSSTGEKPIFDHTNNQEKIILGYVNMLNFYEYNTEKKTEKKNRKDATKTNWIMYEYRLLGDSFQERVICKIKDTSRPGEDQCESIWFDKLINKFPQSAENDDSLIYREVLMSDENEWGWLDDLLSDDQGLDKSTNLVQPEEAFWNEDGQLEFQSSDNGFCSGELQLGIE